MPADQPATSGTRFLTLKQVAGELATSPAVIRGLIHTGDLAAIQIGGRGQWRIERTVLEQYIAGAYESRGPAAGPHTYLPKTIPGTPAREEDGGKHVQQ